MIHTLKFPPRSQEAEKYKPQLLELFTERYHKQLGFGVDLSEIFNRADEIIVSLDDNDNVVGATVTAKDYDSNAQKAIAFAGRNEENVFAAINNNLNTLNALLEGSPVFFETTKELLESIASKFIKKKLKGKLYFFPAEEAAILIPERKIFVLDDGVLYRKRVVRALTFATKCVIANVPKIGGAQGYETFEEASANAKYKNKLIVGKYNGKIVDIPIDPNLIGFFTAAHKSINILYKVASQWKNKK